MPDRDFAARLPEHTWLMTAAAAKLLQLTPHGVHYLVREGRLACEWTHDGRRLFRLKHVLDLVDQRARARIRSRADQLRVLRPRMLRVGLEPRQLALDFSVRLKLVGSRGKGRKVA
jgi:hypothetical protein